MIIETGSTVLDGKVLGQDCTVAFMPCDETSSHAFYECNGHRCGVVYETGGRCYLRFSPDWQLPEGARSKDAWHKFAFESEDERLLELDVDFDDGEVRYIDNEFARDDIGEIEASIQRNVSWLVGLYPEMVRFVRQQLVSGE